MEDCVDDRDARDAICAQPVQAETPLPQRIAVTAQQRPLRRDRQGTLVAGIRSGRVNGRRRFDVRCINYTC